MIKVDLSDVATMTPEDANILVGVEPEKFSTPGVYHVLIGSRSVIEDFEFLGDIDTIEIPTIDELIADYGDIDDEERGYYTQLLEEFYGVNVEDDHVNFAYTEEGYDVWLKIA